MFIVKYWKLLKLIVSPTYTHYGSRDWCLVTQIFVRKRMIFQFDSSTKHFIKMITNYVPFDLLTRKETKKLNSRQPYKISKRCCYVTLKWFSQQNNRLLCSMASPSSPTNSSQCFFLASGTGKNIRSGWLELSALQAGTIHVLVLSGGIFESKEFFVMLLIFDKSWHK